MKVFCPLCRDRRKNKRDKSVSVDLDKGIAYCHYCGETFTARRRSQVSMRMGSLPPTPCRPVERKELRPEHVDWFAKERGISREALERMGVDSKEEWMPQTGKENG